MARKQKKNTAFENLFEIAESQAGFFTARQAIDSGFAENNHLYHVKAGNWVREERGIYRLAHYPETERSELMVWYLWSRNRKDVPLGIYSHETAFSIFELSDLNPLKYHMTVPPSFRRSAPTPKPLVLHRRTLKKADVTMRHGVKVTRPFRTVLDLLLDDRVSLDRVGQGLEEGLKQGLITHAELKNVKTTEKVKTELQALMKRLRI